jgi:hypothetical protein
LLVVVEVAHIIMVEQEEMVAVEVAAVDLLLRVVRQELLVKLLELLEQAVVVVVVVTLLHPLLLAVQAYSYSNTQQHKQQEQYSMHQVRSLHNLLQ